MIHCAMVVLPNAFLASLGAMVDSYSLVFDRLGHIVVAQDKAAPPMELTVLSVDGRPVQVGGGIAYNVDRSIAANDRFDFVWLPSFRSGDAGAMRRRLASSQQLIAWLQAQAANGTAFGASGAAVMLLVEAGLLDGRPVPVSRVFMPTVRTLFPRCHADDRLTQANYDAMFLSAGIGNDFDIIAQAMSKMVSPSSGRWLAEVTAKDASEQRHLSADPLVASAQLWIEQFYATDISMAELAARLSTTPQTLTRRFKNALDVTPKTYAQEMRLKAAQGMLVRSTRSIEEIARFVGYSDVRVFRDAFRKCTGETAGAWRRSNRRGDQKPPAIEG